ncbi:MAG: hypothetical protein ABR529_10705 [Actinomycetota bacterium]
MTASSTTAETRQSLLLWFGILAAPAAWSLQVVIAPDLSEILCYPGAEGSGLGRIYGIEIETVLVALTAGLALVAFAAVLVSLSCWRKLHRTRDATTGRRATWMAGAGIFVSALFLLGILIGFLPMVFLGSCESSL